MMSLWSRSRAISPLGAVVVVGEEGEEPAVLAAAAAAVAAPLGASRRLCTAALLRPAAALLSPQVGFKRPTEGGGRYRRGLGEV